MKIKRTELEVSNIGDFKEIKANIKAEDLGLALTLVSKNLYSNPIGSFIREIASNAVDANKQVNIEDAVLIHIYQEGAEYYIEFKDNGTGMSPDVFENIYSHWFSSDKRDSNESIGGWGLGSKSPLSYQESFEIVTRSEGKEYHYIYANEGSKPAATLLTINNTNSPNGTTIRIEINSLDTFKVYNETIKQLAYFRNIYVKNDVRYYDNNFKLYEADDYILRNVYQPFGVEMHICLGQVAYPINWKILNIEQIDIPVGIKFEIGELDVTLSREEVNYTEEVKEVLIRKIAKVKQILLDKYNEQLQITDFKEYIKILEGTKKPKFIIEDVSIIMTKFDIKPIFSPLPGIKIVKKYIDDLFCFYTVEELRGNRRGNSIKDLSSYISGSYNLDAYLVTDRVNTYDSAYLGNSIALIRRRKIGKGEMVKIARALNLLEDKKAGDTTWPIYKEGYIGVISSVIKYIDNYVTTTFKGYNGIAPDYWIEQYKAEQQGLYEERKQTITHYTIYNTRSTVNWGELIDRYKAIFYISKKESKENIIAYEFLYSLLPAYFRKNSTFLIINPSVITKVKNKRKFVAVERIFKIKQFNNSLYRIKLSYLVDNAFPTGATLFSFSKLYYGKYRALTGEYNKRCRISHDEVPVQDSSYGRSISINIVEHFKDQFNAIKPSKYRTHLKYEENLEELKTIRDKLDILNYLDLSCPHNYKVQIIEKLGVLKLDVKYYKRVINN